MNTKPHLYQRHGARAIQRFKIRALLADEMGLGKTIQSLMAAHRNPELRPVVIVCPAHLKWNWERELAVHFGYRADILSGMKPGRRGLPRDPQFLIINYDILGPWLKPLQELDPQLVIMDEAHYLQSRTSKRTRNCRRLCDGVPHVLALTGTPVMRRPADLWPTLNILRPDLFPNFHAYGWRYCGAKKKPWGMEYNGATNTDELNGILLRELMVRRLKRDVLSQLPPKINSVLPLDIRGRKEYEKAEKNLIAWLRDQSPAKALRAARAEAMVKVGYLRRLAARKKLPAVYDWADGWLDGCDDKLILFAHHTDILEEIHDRYKRESVLVDGGVTGRDRQRAVDAFTKDRRIRLFVGQIDAAGTGWNGAAASAVAFVEFPWVPAKLTQAADRPHRIGQRGTVNVYHLVARDTIEHRLLKILQARQGAANAVLDGGRGEELPVFDLLCEELAGSPRANHRDT